jgi:hypothetical protein
MSRRYILTALILISSIATTAQILKGQVLIYGTDSAIAHASIYFNNMYKRALADKNGYFELQISNSEKASLIVSAIGYSSTTIGDYNAGQFLKVYLKPKVYDLDEVVVTSVTSRMSREKMEKLFKKEFLGTSYSASKCTIENLSDVKLVYNESSKTLEAYSDDPLIIHNPYLEYKITYYIDKFKVQGRLTTNEGHYFFEDDTLLTDNEKTRIDKRRLNSYLGSKMHFIRSLCNRTLGEEGFSIFNNSSQALDEDRILLIKGSQKYLKVKDGIQVVYKNHSKGTHVTDYRGRSLINYKGFFDPASLRWTGGYMAMERVGDLLPYEYGVPGSEEKAQDTKDSIDVDDFITEEDQLKAFLSKLDHYNEATMREKVHLHFDKPYYTVGDTIWFKSYVVNAENNQLSNRSNVLYVELINEKDALKTSLRLPVIGGVAWGDFVLSESFTTGNYRIRAYTTWMRNFDEGLFFDKTIQIGNALISNTTSLKDGSQNPVRKALSAKATSDDVDVRFFPESGNMVAGIRSKIGFKVVGHDGLGKKARGYIINGASEKVAEFSSEYAGMGVFSLTPVDGQAYIARVKFEDGSEKSFELPKVQPSGYVLTVNNEDANNLIIKISTSTKIAAGEEVSIVGQSNGAIHYVSKSRLKEGPIFAFVPKDSLPRGVLQLTLFNSSNQPLVERLVFIRNKSHSTLKITSEKETYTKRSAVKMNVLALDSTNRPIRGFYSVAVTNESDTPFDDVNEHTIESNLLLSSEIKGYIETPNYYFSNPDAQKNKDLDNLMLTQGWRGFDWKSVNAGTLPSFTYKPEQGISISGKVTELLGRPSVGAKVTIISSTGINMIADTITNAEGKFDFNNLMFDNGTSFMVQAKNFKGKDVEISLDPNDPQTVIQKINSVDASVIGNQALMPYLESRAEQFREMRTKGLLNRGIVLSEVKVVREKPKVKHSSNLNGAGQADAVLLAKDLRECPDFPACLQGRVAGMVIQSGIPYLSRSIGTSLSRVPPMQIILDGTYMQGNFGLGEVPVYDIESNEILKTIENTGVYGIQGSGGVMIITTKRGQIRPNVIERGLTSFTPQGFHVSRQFYSPKYDVQENETIRDFRSTIYWAPNLETDPDGKASIEFYTADKPGTYKAVIEGIDSGGSVTRQVHRFDVINKPLN